MHKIPTSKFRAHLSKEVRFESRVKLFFFLSALAILLLAVAKIDNLLVSLLLAMVSSTLLSPAVDWLERKGFSRLMAVTIPFLITILFCVLLIQILLPIIFLQIENLKTDLPKLSSAFEQMIFRLQNRLEVLISQLYPLDLRSQVEPQLREVGKNFIQDLPTIVSRSLTVILLAPFLSFFMLLDGRDFIRSILSLVPNKYFELALNLNHQIGYQIGGFVRARVLQSAIVALVIWTGLMIIHFPYALVLAIVAGVLNVIPYVGPLISFLPALIIALADGAGQSMLVALLVVYGLAQLLDTVLIVPFIVARIVNLHPVTVVLAVLVGGQLMGVMGMIICIPVFSILKVTTIAIYRHLIDFRN